MKKKKNPSLAEAIYLAKKNNLKEIAKAISIPTRQQANVNLEDLSKAKEEIIIIPGKVLGTGNLTKKLKVYAISFSKQAKEKLKKSGSEFKTILEALKENPKLKGEIIR